jgi:2-isopropylmalate synthase
MLKNPQHKYPAFEAIKLPSRRWPDVVLNKPPVWLSTDLRDGNQALIEPMDSSRKLKLFQMLLRIGFKQIEVGFPSASQTDFDFVRRLITQGLVPDDVTIQVLTPAREPLIRRTFEALHGAKQAIVHMYNATSPVMRRVVLGLSETEIVALAVNNTLLVKQLAQAQTDTRFSYQYSPEMFSGTELIFSKQVIDAVTDAWQPTPQHPCIINLPSTIEHCTPNVFADMIEWMHLHLARREALVLSVHPHNDRGTGTAAGELALMAGADRIEGCLFGNGERTGNVDLVNIALNLYTQGIAPGLIFHDIDEVRRCVEHCNQLPVHPRHPYAGDLVYTSFSGSHQDAIKKAFAARQENDPWQMPYLPIDPKDLGRTYDAVIRVNSQSGKGGIAYLLESEYGLELPRRLQIEFSQVVQTVMDDTGKELQAADIWGIFETEYALNDTQRVQLSHPLITDHDGAQVSLSAEVVLDSQALQVANVGAGPIDAFVAGLQRQTGTALRVLDYHEHAIGSGANARAVAYLELRVAESHSLFGVGIDTSIVSASLKAILSGLSRYRLMTTTAKQPSSH